MIHQPQQELFNLEETEKSWEESFYESDWEVDTLTKTKVEEAISHELSYFLPRHMMPYDWNLPFIDEIILVIRRAVKGIKFDPKYERNAK